MKESQLENKTAIATNDYVRMVDENGNSVKIKKDSFMAAIRDALPSILESGDTGGGSVLSVIGGILKTRTDAGLASVLGVSWAKGEKGSSTNIDDISERCFFIVLSSNQSAKPFPFTPDSNHRAFGFSSGDIAGLASRRFQVLMLETVPNPKFYFRTKAPGASGGWSSWKEVATV